jgi:hypothetical protein
MLKHFLWILSLPICFSWSFDSIFSSMKISISFQLISFNLDTSSSLLLIHSHPSTSPFSFYSLEFFSRILVSSDFLHSMSIFSDEQFFTAFFRNCKLFSYFLFTILIIWRWLFLILFCLNFQLNFSLISIASILISWLS